MNRSISLEQANNGWIIRVYDSDNVGSHCEVFVAQSDAEALAVVTKLLNTKFSTADKTPV